MFSGKICLPQLRDFKLHKYIAVNRPVALRKNYVCLLAKTQGASHGK
jgi:hypothetical protein